jgi:integrase
LDLPEVQGVLGSASQGRDDAREVLRWRACCTGEACTCHAQEVQEEEIMTSLETAVDRSADLRPRTKELYLQHVRSFLVHVGASSSDKLNDEHVVAWRDDMVRRKISPQSVNVALNALRFAAEHAKLTKLAESALQRRLAVSEKKKKAAAKKSNRALTWNEGRALITECEGVRGRDRRDNAIITLGLRTGMLRFSMCQLSFADVDFPYLTFVKKGGEKHTIQLDDVTRRALESWMAWLEVQGVKKGHLFRSLGRQRVDSHDTAIGDQLTPDGLYRALRERAHKAEIDDLHPHVFRKTFLAWAKETGAHPGQIAAVTGHKSDAAGDDGVTTPPANMLLPAWTAKKLG